jgi:four helix bundle protein
MGHESCEGRPGGKGTAPAWQRRPHRQLALWEAAMELVTNVYALTRVFPRAEVYGLTSQMRRAAVSIPSNISEGAARKTSREYLQFLYTARGSVSELDTQLEIASRLGYLKKTDLDCAQSQLDRVSRLLSGLVSYLRRQEEP